MEMKNDHKNHEFDNKKTVVENLRLNQNNGYLNKQNLRLND